MENFKRRRAIEFSGEYTTSDLQNWTIIIKIYFHKVQILPNWLVFHGKCSKTENRKISNWLVFHEGSVPSDGVKGVRRRLVEFLVFNWVYWKKSVPSNGVNRVRHEPVHALQNENNN